MLITGVNYKTVFIMGAGATRGAVGHVRINGKMVKPPLNSDFFKVADAFANACGSNSPQTRCINHLRSTFKKDISAKGNLKMEEAFSRLYMAKDFPEIYNSGPGRKSKSGSQREIRNFLDLLFSILVRLDNNSHDNGYDQLVKNLGSEDTIITLNYDTLIDSALVRQGWSPKTGYCLSGGKHKITWDPANSQKGGNLQKVHLLKLHGSLNWWIKGKDITRIFKNKPVRVTSTL